MARMDYRTLIDRGRKAGLVTSELYRALATFRPETGDNVPEQADSNGFVPGYGQNGRRVYRPATGRSLQ